jgi:glycosyltransferase involved in cell wall biosynthesis
MGWILMGIPKVSILLATYYPNEKFLYKQLISISQQTYPNLELLVCDDSGDKNQHEIITNILKRTIGSVPYRILKNNRNLGSNKTFEKLTLEATGEYISYCDQDDIWEIDKIEKLVNEMKENDSSLIYSDLSIIDAKDDLIKSSFKKMNFRLKHINGDSCFFRLVRRNSVTGCTVLIKADIAKNACPFPESKLYPHDHWLSIFSSVNGRIGYVNEPLVKYRIHGSNQIGNKRFINIKSIREYVNERIIMQSERYRIVENRIILNELNSSELLKEKSMLNARRDFYQNKSLLSFFRMLGYLKNDPVLIIFEIILFILPGSYSSRIIQYLK